MSFSAQHVPNIFKQLACVYRRFIFRGFFLRTRNQMSQLLAIAIGKRIDELVQFFIVTLDEAVSPFLDKVVLSRQSAAIFLDPVICFDNRVGVGFAH